MRDANKVVAKALETAGLNARDFALKMGISSSSLRKYGYDSRTPTPPLLKRLARLLRQQARDLQRVSRELEQVARKEKATLWLHRVPGGRRRAKR
jgi:ribosome-binding protein aMBF1 (putative translation factor)